MDVLVLTPAYPSALLDKKLYLAAGVAAAFECKTTLKKEHIARAVRTAAIVHRLAHPSGDRSTRRGNPYDELHSGIVYGLLAHAHSWVDATAVDHVGNAVEEGVQNANHPRDLLDVVCVASLGTWTTMKTNYVGPSLNIWHLDQLRLSFPEGYASAVALGPAPSGTFVEVDGAFPNIPVAQLCAFLTSRLAREDPSMRPIADYFRVAGLLGQSQGSGKAWRLSDVYSAEVTDRLRRGGISWGEVWNSWSHTYM